MNTLPPSPARADLTGGNSDHAATVRTLQRTWEAGAGRVTVTFDGAAGNHWDIEQSARRQLR